MLNTTLILCAEASVPAGGAWLRVLAPSTACVFDLDEVASLARFCVRRATLAVPDDRIAAHWTVRVEPARPSGYVSYVTAEGPAVFAQARDLGRDAALAVWDAFAAVEHMLRERTLAPRA